MRGGRALTADKLGPCDLGGDSLDGLANPEFNPLP